MTVHCTDCKHFKWEYYERHTEPRCLLPSIEYKDWRGSYKVRRDPVEFNRHGDCPDFEQKPPKESLYEKFKRLATSLGCAKGWE